MKTSKKINQKTRKNSFCIYDDDIRPESKEKEVFQKRIEIIVKKIIKNSTLEKSTENLLVHNCEFDTFQKIQYLNNLIPRSIDSKKKTDDRSFIANKLSDYIHSIFPDSIKIADIGGGNGNVLKKIAINLDLPRENLYSVEQIFPWSEPYAFTNHEFLQYIFWDNKTIPDIKADSIDVVLIMVSLHHMNNNTINVLFKNLQKIMKPDSILIIKEHDCKTPQDKYVIDWEHHLYHIMETNKQSDSEISNYLNYYIDNFKTKKQFDKLILKYGYTPIQELNRLFDSSKDYKNPTNLYWKIYRKT
jgi:SAM-dependent methyltransferase